MGADVAKAESPDNAMIAKLQHMAHLQRQAEQLTISKGYVGGQSYTASNLR